jgi:hypothetical protein
MRAGAPCSPVTLKCLTGKVLGMNHKVRIRGAFAQMRREGIMARVGVNGCCRTCIWAEHDEWEGKPVFWGFAGQGNRLSYDEDGNLYERNVVFFYHNSAEFPEEIARCVEILKFWKLPVSWDGDAGRAVKLNFATTAVLV